MKKSIKKCLARALALAVVASMTCSYALAASFDDLQNAIENNTSEGEYIGEKSEDHYGYGKTESEDGSFSYGVESWTSTTENEDGTTSTNHNVQLNEDVSKEDGEKDRVIVDKEDGNVVLDLNDQTITGEKQPITVTQGANLTITDSGEDGTIQSEGSFNVVNSGTLNLEDGTVEGGKYGVYTYQGGDTTIGENAEVSGTTNGAFVGANSSLETSGSITGGSYGVSVTDGTVEVTGGTVSGNANGVKATGSDVTINGDASVVGNGVYAIAADGSNVTIGGNASVENTRDNVGNGISAGKNSTVTIEDNAKIVAPVNGIALTDSESTLTVNGGRIEGGSGAIYVNGFGYISDADDSDRVTFGEGVDILNSKIIFKPTPTEPVELTGFDAPNLEGYYTRKVMFNFYLDPDLSDSDAPDRDIEKRLAILEKAEITYSYEIDGVTYIGHTLEPANKLANEAQFWLNIPYPVDTEAGDFGPKVTLTIKIPGTEFGDCHQVAFNEYSKPVPTPNPYDYYSANGDGDIRLVLNPRVTARPDTDDGGIFFLYFKTPDVDPTPENPGTEGGEETDPDPNPNPNPDPTPVIPDPDPDPDPTPVIPDPDPDPDPTPVIPDPDVPLVEEPDVEIPEVDVPLVEEPNVEIPEEEVPLAEVPEGLVIEDENVPLADVPKTGDISSLWYLTTLLSACGLALLGLRKKDNI